jgi:hypothetical protein
MAVRTGRVLGLALVGIALSMLAGLAFPASMNQSVRTLTVGTLAVVGFIGVMRAAWTPRYAWYHVAVGGLVAATCLSAITSSIPSAAPSAVLLSASLAGVGFLALDWTGSNRGRQDAAVIVGVGLTCLVAGTFLFRCAAVFLEWTQLGMPVAAFPLRPAAVGGLVPGPLWTSDYLVLTAPVGLVVLWQAGRIGRVAAVAFGAMAIVALVLGGTRSLWLAEAIILLAFALLWLRRSGRLPRRVWAPALVVAVLLVATVFVTGRLTSIITTLDEGRSDAAAAAVSIAAEHPVTGSGPATYGSEKLGQPADNVFELALPDSHNLITETAAELGLVGLAALLVAGFVILQVCVRAGPSADLLAVAAAAGLAAVAPASSCYRFPGRSVASRPSLATSRVSRLWIAATPAAPCWRPRMHSPWRPTLYRHSSFDQPHSLVWATCLRPSPTRSVRHSSSHPPTRRSAWRCCSARLDESTTPST